MTIPAWHYGGDSSVGPQRSQLDPRIKRWRGRQGATRARSKLRTVGYAKRARCQRRTWAVVLATALVALVVTACGSSGPTVTVGAAPTTVSPSAVKVPPGARVGDTITDTAKGGQKLAVTLVAVKPGLHTAANSAFPTGYPDGGRSIVGVVLKIENVGTTSITAPIYSAFQAVDQNGQSFSGDMELSTSATSINQFDSVAKFPNGEINLQPGESTLGEIGIIVPPGSNIVTIISGDDRWSVSV